MPNVFNNSRKKIDKEQLTELYKRYAPLIYARAKRIVGDEADDIVQEVFMKLIKKTRNIKNITAWVYRTSTNICLDRLRYKNRRDALWKQKIQSMSKDYKEYDLEAVISNKELCQKVLSTMKPKIQEVVVFVHIDEMSKQETASLLGISRKTVSKRLEKFYINARKILNR